MRSSTDGYAMWQHSFAIFWISAAIWTNSEQALRVDGPDTVSPSYSTTEANQLSTCPKGFEREGMYCYHVVKNQTNWLGAVQICKQKNSSLAKPLTQHVDRLLRKHIGNPKFKRVQRWIDITYNAELRQWVLGTTSERIPYDGFARKTSEMELEEHCAVMDPMKSHAWVARICHRLYDYVCQTPQASAVASNSIDESPVCPKDFWHVGTNCYYIGDKKVTWLDATNICKEMNSTLAKSITEEIDRLLRAHLAELKFDAVERWIDVRYHPKKQEWVLGETGEKIPYDGFSEKESTKNPDQHCAVMEPKENFAWVPMMCHKLKYAVCEISLADASTSPVPALPILSANSVTTHSIYDSNNQAPTGIRRPPACPKGFRRGGTNCYHCSRERANWFDAIQICSEKNSSLANRLTEDLEEQLRNQTAGFKRVERWIDVTYDPIMKDWVSGITGKKIPYDGFWKKLLNNDSDAYCAVVNPRKNFAWKPRMCHKRRHYVCQMPLADACISEAPEICRPPACPEGFRRGGTNCYHVSREETNWSDAIQICSEKNSSLANRLTEDLEEQLRNQTAGFKQVERWIDVTYDPIMKDWVSGITGKKIPYDGFWKKPFNNDSDYCAVVNPKKNFAWTPRMCHQRRHYVCQMPLGKLREQSPKKLNSTSETIEQQKTESNILKTNDLLDQNGTSEPLYSVMRRKKESSLSPKSAPKTESSVNNVVKSEDSNVPDQSKENLTKPSTGNYRTESRISATEPSSPLIERIQLTNKRSCFT